MSFRLEHVHGLSEDDARGRVRALGDYLSNKYGLTVTWSADDRATIRGKYLVVEIEGTVALSPGRVSFEGKDPGMLFRGKAKDYLGGKLAKYLDPKNALDSLPRR